MTRVVGVVNDERYLEHKTGIVHPESPNRLKYLYRMLENEFSGVFVPITPQAATLEDLELVHTPYYVKKVLRTADRGFTNLSFDTPASDKTYLAAWLAVGGCITAVDMLMERSLQSAFALLRPPGHHALPDRAGGFCVFNNLGVTARNALLRHGLDRILIIDWDVHHGNGLHDLFYAEKEVFYISSHFTTIYPYSGYAEQTGKGAGEGYTLNIPLWKGVNDDDLIHIYGAIVIPAIRRFRPQLIMVAAGFDLHHLDSMSRSNVTETGFGLLTRRLLEEIGDTPVLLALEGGYKVPVLVKSVREVLLELLGGQAERRSSESPSRDAQELVDTIKQIHAPFKVWEG